jgi:hypothetical protein
MPDDRITQELRTQKQSNSSSNRYIKLEKLVIMHILLQNLTHQQVSSMVTPRSLYRREAPQITLVFSPKRLRRYYKSRLDYIPLLMKIAFLRSVADRLLNVARAMLKNRALFNPLVRVENRP